MASSLVGVFFVLVGYVLIYELCSGDNRQPYNSGVNFYQNSINQRRTSESSAIKNLQRPDSYHRSTSVESTTAETINHCISTVKRAGTYRIHGNAQRSWKLVPHCELFLIAPPMHSIRLIFRNVDVDCDTSGVLIQDGWTTLSNNQGQRDFIPLDDLSIGDADSNNKRKLFVCSKNAAIFKTLTTSQNYGQISYKIQKAESLTFDVEFVPSDNMCDDLITAEENIATYILHTNRPRNCRVYISGSARLKLLDFRLETETAKEDSSTCGKADTTYVSLQVNSTSWKQLPMRRRLVQCKTDFSDVIIPCQYNVLELHSTVNKLQYVKFTLEELSDSIKEPWSALCY